MNKGKFKTEFARRIFLQKYALTQDETWDECCRRVVEDVCGSRWGKDRPLMSKDERDQLTQYMIEMKFIPAGRFLSYAGREAHFWNNCYVGIAREDTREEWARFVYNAMSVLTTGGGFGGEYCLDSSTKILKSDLSWVDVSTLCPGDRIIAFDEALDLQKGIVQEAVVEATSFVYRPSYRLYTTEGEVIASAEHKWVARCFGRNPKRKGAGYHWIDTDQLKVGDEIAFTTKPWTVDSSFEGGWFSGILDGEGWLSVAATGKTSMGVAQKSGIVLDRMKKILNARLIKYHQYSSNSVEILAPMGKWERLKVLGTFRPIRLMQNAKSVWDGAKPGGKTTPAAAITRIEFLGERRLVGTKTSTGTLIANGFLSHNSAFRPSGRTLKRTGGVSSGPIPLMKAVNEIGRNVQQGGSRRSALWSGLNWQHEDTYEYLHIKDWTDIIKQCKTDDFNFPAPLDLTNISIQWDTALWDKRDIDILVHGSNDKTMNLPKLWFDSVEQMCKTGEPGHSYNFWNKELEIGRNPCAEFISDRDSDVCCLGSVNLGNIETLNEFSSIIDLGSRFLISATVRAELPYSDVSKTREESRKIGLGLMGVHEWLLQRNKEYGVDDELRTWLEVYKRESENAAKDHAERLYISTPVRFRAIAPAGTLSILAATSSGIEPMFAAAYKRRYLSNGTRWKYEYIIDATAQRILDETGCRADSIETAYKLSQTLEGVERRVKMQADIQSFVDMGISSTINLSEWGSEGNSEEGCGSIARLLARYAPRLRGITMYPNGSRGGQPLTEVPYAEAKRYHGIVYDEEETKGCSSGVCGI